MRFVVDNSFIKIAITPPYFYQGEAQAISSLLQGREFDYVHLRKPEATEPEMAELLKEIPEEFRGRITLHDHFTLADKFGIGGIHLNSRSSQVPSGWHGRVSRSAHSFSECNDCYTIDYVTLSPIFDSISKPGYQGLFNKQELDSFLKETKARVVALGGVTHHECDYLKTQGFHGVAMLSDAWRKHIDLSCFKLQFITNPVSVSDVYTQVKNALQGGCRWIQLRWKEAPDRDIIEASSPISVLCKEYGAVFLLDDHVELVEICHADGVHLGKNDMPLLQARKILGPGKIIGATANTPEDIFIAASDSADYVGYGPFRFTTTKKKLSPVLGLDGYKIAMEFMSKQGIRLPVVAIGGIEKDDIADIMSTSVDGVAVSGAIIRSDNPVVSTERIIKALANNNQD